MKKVVIASLALALALAGCGPSEQEIQARIDKEVAQKVETLKAEMKAERAAEKAAELEAAAAAEEKRKAEEKVAAEAARLAQEAAAEEERLAKEQKVKQAQAAGAAKRKAETARFAALKGKCGITTDGNIYTVKTSSLVSSAGSVSSCVPELITILEIPQNIVLKIQNTRPINGVQEDTFRDIKVSWSLDRTSMSSFSSEDWTFIFKLP